MLGFNNTLTVWRSIVVFFLYVISYHAHGGKVWLRCVYLV